VRGAAHEEFVCEVVDELADWDHRYSIIRRYIQWNTDRIV